MVDREACGKCTWRSCRIGIISFPQWQWRHCWCSGSLRDFWTNPIFFSVQATAVSKDENSRCCSRGVFATPNVWLHFPAHFLPPTKAKAQWLIVENVKCQLDLVKSVNSTEKLQYWGMLLDATVSGNIDSQKKTFSKVLQTQASNLKLPKKEERVCNVVVSPNSNWEASRRGQTFF